MDLNDYQNFAQLDTEHMLAYIDELPIQLEAAYKLGMSLVLPAVQPVERIVAAGMGGSAIGADLVAAYLADQLKVPFLVHRDYNLPAWAADSQTFVVVSSHSGNTEEALSAFETAQSRGCQLLAICTGGKLEAECRAAGITVWKFDHTGQPRAAVGYSFGLLLALLTKLQLIEDQTHEFDHACEVMTSLQARIKAEVPVIQNAAKRQAGQFVNRHVTIFASGFLSPVARRWKTQFNEVAKAFAAFEVLPEADHNTLAGIYNPAQQVCQEYAMFLAASLEHPRNFERVEKTRQLLMLEGIGTDTFNAKGENRLAQMWSSLLFGDYVAYYLAMLYDADPTRIPPITLLKEELSQ